MGQQGKFSFSFLCFLYLGCTCTVTVAQDSSTLRFVHAIYVKSTSYNRTIMSALANLAGMYPPSGNQIWSPTILWQPIPVHSQPRETDPMLWMEAECPVEDKLYEAVMQSEEVGKIMEEHESFIDFVREKTGLSDKFQKLDDMWHAYDPLNCEYHHNATHKWPKWVNSTVFAKVKELYELSTVFYYHTPAIQRLRGGLLLNDILSRMIQKQTKNQELLDQRLKYYVYSAHDTTVNSLLSILGAYNGINPPYASCVLLELHERNNGNWEVELWFRNDSSRGDPYQLQISGCSSLSCSLKEFGKRSQPLIPKDWRKECGLAPLFSVGSWRMIVFGMCALSTVLFVALLFVLFQWWQLRRGSYTRAPLDSVLNSADA